MSYRYNISGAIKIAPGGLAEAMRGRTPPPGTWSGYLADDEGRCLQVYDPKKGVLWYRADEAGGAWAEDLDALARHGGVGGVVAKGEDRGHVEVHCLREGAVTVYGLSLQLDPGAPTEAHDALRRWLDGNDEEE